jgi:hypothetical protein
MKLTTKVGTIAQDFSVSIKKCDGVHKKKPSDNFNKNLSFRTILSEHEITIIYCSPVDVTL